MRAALALVLLAGCDPTVYDGVRAAAPVFVVQAPGGAATGNFGAVIVGYAAHPNGMEVSRFAVTGGDGSATVAWHAYDGLDTAQPVPRYTDAAVFFSCDMSECGMGFGRSIAAFPEWQGPGGAIFHGCIASPATSGQTTVRCEDQLPFYQTVGGPTAEAYGSSAAGIDFPQHRVGAALLGAPDGAAGDGRLYRFPWNGLPPLMVDLSGAMAPPGSHLGTTLAVTPLSNRTARFALGTHATGTVQRVVVGTIDIDDAMVTSVAIEACLLGDAGYGGALAFGDLDGDMQAELLVGSSAASSVQGVDIFDPGAFTGTDCTVGVQPMPILRIRCSDLSESVVCDTQSELGAALAVGDFDGDGANDLAIGAPGATVQGRAAAGAVFVLAGQAGSIAMLGVGDGRHSVVFPSTARDQMRLGTAVAAFGGNGRDELIAGAPLVREVDIFFCTGLSGDRPGDVPRAVRGCIPP